VRKEKTISRRDFLKFAGLNLAGLAFRGLPGNATDWISGWPGLRLGVLPGSIRDILRRVPNLVVAQNGYLYFHEEFQFLGGQLPLACTGWNLERSKPVDELFPDMRWGIVLHWYGDPDYFDRSLKGFLRGFNSVRHIADYETQTSAHFLVGDKPPSTHIERDEDFFGIVQTQQPSPSGVPYLASHLNNYAVRDFEGEQYFINALYKLGLAEGNLNPVLQDLYEGPDVDPNFRTIAVEIAGSDFENPNSVFPPQKMANVVAVVWALMKRYQIRAIDILGHHEVQLGNSDPGKKFMALIRFLIGIKALVDRDITMFYLVFGNFLGENETPSEAVKKYFDYVRDYLVLVGLPEDVYEWESRSKYWFVHDCISSQTALTNVIGKGQFPLQDDSMSPGNWFLDPDNHEGIDIYVAGEGSQMVRRSSGAYLVTNGVCKLISENRGFHHGKMAVFSHRQPDGAQVLTVYGHLKAIGDIKVGQAYPVGHRLGSIGGLNDGSHTFLHFSTAYGATWDTHFSHNPNVPLDANAKWVRRHFLQPEEFLMKVIV